MKDTPIDYQAVNDAIQKCGIRQVGTASIREIKKLIDCIESATGQKFVRMEMGIPGLPPSKIGVEAQIKALQKGVAAIYPDIHGIPELKQEIARFVRLFVNTHVSPEG